MKQLLTALLITLAISCNDSGTQIPGEEFGPEGTPIDHPVKKASLETATTNEIDTTTLDSASKVLYNQYYK